MIGGLFSSATYQVCKKRHSRCIMTGQQQSCAQPIGNGNMLVRKRFDTGQQPTNSPKNRIGGHNLAALGRGMQGRVFPFGLGAPEQATRTEQSIGCLHRPQILCDYVALSSENALVVIRTSLSS